MRIQACRICGNKNLKSCIDIGEQYLSSIFPKNIKYRQEIKKYPLEIVLCTKGNDSHCGTLQLAFDQDITDMYKQYPYASGANSEMRVQLGDVAKSGMSFKNLKDNDVVLDIGCNDGTLLTYFENQKIKLIGIDPADNIESKVNSKSFTRAKAVFSENTYKEVASEKAKLVFCVAMFYHLSDPVQFCKDLAAILHSDGVVIIQMAYLPAMIRTNMYDNIVHEHVAYYGAHQMNWILERAGLEIFDVQLNNVYGGSFRIFARREGNPRYPIAPRLKSVFKDEISSGIFNPATYTKFMERIEKTGKDLVSLIAKLNKEGKKIWIYGASTKGNTILQFCGLGAQDIVAAADSNPFKHGKFLIGSDIPIADENKMRAAKPDYLLALPYSFVEAFREREKELVATGTKFIVPLPEVRII